MLNNSKDFQELLHEVLDTKIVGKTHHDKLLQSILSKPERTLSVDFQEMLKKNIKPLSHDKFKKQLLDKQKKRKIEHRKKNIDAKNHFKSGENINEIVKGLEKEKEEEKLLEGGEKKGENLSSREEALKMMYSAALDEYNNLRDNLYKTQIRDNDISLDDRNYTKLLLYENYLRKCDTLFKQTNGSFISKQDPDISKKENKYEYDAAKSEKKVLSEHQHSIDEIERLNIAIEDKANQIIDLNQEAAKGRVSNYDKKLENLEQDYIELTGKMHTLEPNILELYRQEEAKDEQEKTTSRIVGPMYEKRKDKYVLDADVVRLDKKVEGKEDKLENAAEIEKNEFKNTNVKLANSYIDAAEAALEKQDVDEARHLVTKARELVGYKELDEIADEKNIDLNQELKQSIMSEDEIEKPDEPKESETARIDAYVTKSKDNNENLSPVQQECMKAVYTPEERNQNILERETKEELEQVKEVEMQEKVEEKTR